MKIIITFCKNVCALLEDSEGFKEKIELEPSFKKLLNYEKDFLNKFIEQMDYQKRNFLSEGRFELIGESIFFYDEATIKLSLEENKITFYSDSGFDFNGTIFLSNFEIKARLEGDEEVISSLKSYEIYDELMISMKPYVDEISEKIQEYIEDFGF